MNALTIGIDVAKEFHWVVAIVPHPETGKARQALSRKVANTPGDIAAQLVTGMEAGREDAPAGHHALVQRAATRPSAWGCNRRVWTAWQRQMCSRKAHEP